AVAGSIGARAANATTGVRYLRPLWRPTWCSVAHGGTRDDTLSAYRLNFLVAFATFSGSAIRTSCAASPVRAGRDGTWLTGRMRIRDPRRTPTPLSAERAAAGHDDGTEEVEGSDVEGSDVADADATLGAGTSAASTIDRVLDD